MDRDAVNGVRIHRPDTGDLRVTAAAYERGGRAWLNEDLEPGCFYRAGQVSGPRLRNPHGALPPELFDAERQVLFVAGRNARDDLDWRVPVVSCGRQERAWAALG